VTVVSAMRLPAKSATAAAIFEPPKSRPNTTGALTFAVASLTQPRSPKSQTSSKVSYYFLLGKDLAASMSMHVRAPRRTPNR
jgi:hypothetical protein